VPRAPVESIADMIATTSSGPDSAARFAAATRRFDAANAAIAAS
jgi:hypothetical protein